MSCCRILRFCCCCSLRTGTIVIAILGCILTIIQAMIWTESLVETIKYDSENKSSEELEGLEYEIPFSIIAVLVSSFLIAGIIKKNHYFFLPWIIINAIANIIFSLSFVIILISGIINGTSVNLRFLFMLMFGIPLFLDWYFWICVFSYYKEVQVARSSGGGRVYYSPTSV